MPLREDKRVSRAEVRRVVSLLKNTHMSIADIAAAVGCTRYSVSKVNKKYGIRLYSQHRTRRQMPEGEQERRRSSD